MTARTLSPGPLTALAEDVRDHGYAILQTRVERVPRLAPGQPCMEPDGCDEPGVLLTVAVKEVEEAASEVGVRLAKDDADNPIGIVTCAEHRAGATHDLFFMLTGRERPDGIRVFDALPGHHLDWH
ncbi:hypothetical protein ABZZ36_18275 [Actinacidiphila glaucinigra]|uniref:hypothetical protein n=1 Tax=Actinacidiphila glaucinigra TaxID=235986 RepID=UPI0033A76BF7